jgi:hypothetical protein
MKHVIGGMDATIKELIFKAFMCFRCTFKAFGVMALQGGSNESGGHIKQIIYFFLSKSNFFFFFCYGARLIAPLA